MWQERFVTIVLAMCCISEARGDDKDDEIARLQKEVMRQLDRAASANKERDTANKECARLQQEIDTLRANIVKLKKAADPRALEYAQNEASRLFKSFMVELENVFHEQVGIPEDAKAGLVAILQATVNRWRGNKPDRAAFVFDAADWLDSKVVRLREEFEDKNRKLIEGIARDASELQRAMSGRDKGDVAALLGKVEGLKVRWVGTVIEVHQNVFLFDDFEASCNGIKVEVRLADRSGGRPALGSLIRISGEISRVEDYGFLGITVQVVDARISTPFSSPSGEE
jgi:hypothetical protein